MKIYYARCVAIYNTPQQARDLALLKNLGFEVVDPNKPEHDAGYKARGMDHFADLLQTCDGIAFRALPDGRIPAGVAFEIAVMQKEGKPVIELPSGIASRKISVEETREFLHEVGNR